MVRRIVQYALPVVLALVSASFAYAQTEYAIPDGTSIDYIYYGVQTPYTNTFFSDYPLTVGGVQYYVTVTMHFTEGDQAATYGSITFTQYTTSGSTSVTENLTGIDYNPFSLKTATATASFAGQFNGSLTFNIQQFTHPRPPCNRYCTYDALTTVNGVHSNFTLE